MHAPSVLDMVFGGSCGSYWEKTVFPDAPHIGGFLRRRGIQIPADAFLDLEREKMSKRILQATMPIYAEDDRGRIGLEGSGVLLSFAGQKHLVTAAHVLDAHTKLGKRLCVLPDDLAEQPVPLEGFEAIETGIRQREDRMDDPYDFALLPLPPRVESGIPKRIPITPGEMLIASRPIAANVFGIVGYPGAPNKVDVKHRRIRPAPQLYTLKRAQQAAYERLQRHPAINIVFTMNVEAMKDDNGNVVRAPHPKGVSGGGVWQVAVPAERDELTFCPKLVGVFTEWYKQHKLACGTKIVHVLKAAATRIPGAREELERGGFTLD